MGSSVDRFGPAASAVSRWERGYEHVVTWTPYVTLAFGAAFALLDPEVSGSDRWMTVGLTAVAAAWVFVMFTDARRRGRDGPPWMWAYFIGMLALALALMRMHPLFFVFAITGFVHAFVLRPAVATFLGVLLTSLVINSGIVYPNPTAEGFWLFGVIVTVQTLAIGIGIVGGEKLAEISEQRRQALIELGHAEDVNAALQARLVAQAHETGVAEERQRLAREIHDTIAQGLIGVVTQLEAAGSASADPVEVRRRIDTAARLARDSLSEARRSVSALVPEPLEERGLPDALDQVVAGWSAINKVAADMSTTGTPHVLRPEAEVTLLRVVQEALANVAKHAGASRVMVTLSYMGDAVAVDVRDDGAGIGGDGSPPAGFGLTAMRQRVEALDGALEVESEPGRGTAVSASLPVPAPVAATSPDRG